MAVILPPVAKARILRDLADAFDANNVQPTKIALSDEFALEMNELMDLVTKHGYPRPASMRHAADVLEGRASTPVKDTPSARAILDQRPAPAQSGDLLFSARASTSKQIRALAEKITGELDKLRALVDADQEKAAARAEVARLEKQLKAAKAKLTGKAPAKPKPVTGEASAHEIRAWARENKVECPGTGRIPQDVRNAYLEATG